MKALVTVDWDISGIQSAFPQVQFVKALKTADQIAEAPNAEILFGHVSRDVFLAARQLRWLQCQGAGVDFMLKVPELVASEVIVTNTRGAHASTIAEHAFGMIIFLARSFRTIEAANRARRWERLPEEMLFGLSGKTLGVVGLGNIGRAVAKRAHAFDMNVLAVDAMDVERPEYVAEVTKLDGLESLLRRSDVVVVCCPYTEATRGMIGSEQLSCLKSTAYLLLVSRGGIVDEDALIDALRSGRLAGAGLDAQSKEPLPPDSPLWDAPNIFLTPHCSGRSFQTTDNVLAIFADNLGRYLAGKPLMNMVDKQRGF